MSKAADYDTVLDKARQAGREAHLSTDGFCSGCHVRLPEVVRSAVRRGDKEPCPNCLSPLSPRFEPGASLKHASGRPPHAP